MRSSAMLRNRMLADPSFLFKIGTEVREACSFYISISKADSFSNALSLRA